MDERVATGVPGLDFVLAGGFPRDRLYLLQGDPGVGKTTLAIQYLREGARLGEKTLYVTLSETRAELIAVARSHGWSLDGVEIYEMSAGETFSAPEDDENTLYVPAEVELGERMEQLLAVVARVEPRRVVIDSCTELRLLAQSQLRFRRQLLALKDVLVKRGCTTLLIETSAGGDPLLQSLVHGVVLLEQLAPLYGAARRRLRVVKLREVDFRGGFHDFALRRDGVVVFPRLVAAEHHESFPAQTLSSGIAEIDALLGGGLDRGTSTLLVGPSGTGKSALATQYATAAAARGEKVAMFNFEEGLGTIYGRAAAIGCDLAAHVEAGRIRLTQIDPAELSPGEFVAVVRHAIEVDGAQMIVVDSLNGYMHAMPEERFLTLQLHELLSYLRQRGVSALMTMVQHGLIGDSISEVDVSYLADTVILLRYFEAAGRIHKAMSVVKKRAGHHEDTIREFHLGPGGFVVSPPLESYRGVLSGVADLWPGRGGAGGSKP
jgi:circadian clock protein KaiC